MSTSRFRQLEPGMRRARGVLLLVASVLAWPVIAQTPPPDFCGCRNHPASLGAFDTRDMATWPPGTTVTGTVVTLPLPADGVMVFDSIHIERGTATPCCQVEVNFARNAANTAVTLLVKGNVTLANNQSFLSVSGNNGAAGNTNTFGAGGLGGNGGFRAGDAAFRPVTTTSDGGAGLGPGGGLGGKTPPRTLPGNGTFLGSTDLLPIVGGSGGGGGLSDGTTCSGGGGGGGGGAILIAANGSILVNGQIRADGGEGGAPQSWPCASGGAGGSGGAIRLIADTISGSGQVLARGGRRWDDSAAAGAGAVRLEALNNTLGATQTTPVATRASAPGPLANPFNPTIAITAVNGQPVPQPPQGGYAVIDIQLAAPGATMIDLETSGVPSGTVIEVKAKPRVGPAPIVGTTTLTNCAESNCLARVTVDLGAGSYTIEARATFLTAVP